MAALGAMAAEAGRCSRRRRARGTLAVAAGTPARVVAVAVVGARARARARARGAALSSLEQAIPAEERGETVAAVVSWIGALVAVEEAVLAARRSGCGGSCCLLS